jgi:hypothetical protein
MQMPSRNPTSHWTAHTAHSPLSATTCPVGFPLPSLASLASLARPLAAGAASKHFSPCRVAGSHVHLEMGQDRHQLSGVSAHTDT